MKYCRGKGFKKSVNVQPWSPFYQRRSGNVGRTLLPQSRFPVFTARENDGDGELDYFVKVSKLIVYLPATFR